MFFTFPLNRIGAPLTTFLSSEQSEEVSNQLGWSTLAGAALVGGWNSQQPLAQAPLAPLSCLHPPLSSLPSSRVRGGKLMQISASESSGIKMGPLEAVSLYLGNSSSHWADLSPKVPTRVVSRNHVGGGRGAGGAAPSGAWGWL